MIEQRNRKHMSMPLDLNRMPAKERSSMAQKKYADAVALYSASDMSLCLVAKACGVTARGFSAYIGRHHRQLLFARYGLEPNSPSLNAIKVRPPKGQSLKTHLKYKEAIEACGDIAYIEYNVSQVARLFDLDGPALASQLRVYYPDVIPNRERLRQRLGIADNTHRGPRISSQETYSEAMNMYRDTDFTLPQVAEKCGVSLSGLRQYMRFYHKDILSFKAARRSASRSESDSLVGSLSGNGRLYGPKPETAALYAEALEQYRTTSKTIKEIAADTGVPFEGFRWYLHQWHKEERLQRNGVEQGEMSTQGSRVRKSASEKYAPAIDSLRKNPRPISKVAEEFGLNPDVFRQYLKKHQPEFALQFGRKRSSAREAGAAASILI